MRPLGSVGAQLERRSGHHAFGSLRSKRSHQQRHLVIRAGLNYPHMPNRLRRQRQELVYTFRRQRDKALTFLRKTPVGGQAVEIWKKFLVIMDPLITSFIRLRDYLKFVYREQVFNFYDYTMDETKRKYKWEAYSEQEKKWWIDTLTFIGDRLAVVVGFGAFIICMPCTVLWTLVVPYLIAWRNLEHGKGLWKYFWAVLIVMQPLKHSIYSPIRWLF